MNTSLRLRRIVPITLVALATVGVGAAVIASNDDSDDRPIPVEPDGGIGDTPGDEFPVEAARESAHAVLGIAESELDDDVRIARRGDEQFALTEDYQLGRLTVELDDDGDGFRVTAVTVELPDGPEMLHLAAG